MKNRTPLRNVYIISVRLLNAPSRTTYLSDLLQQGSEPEHESTAISSRRSSTVPADKAHVVPIIQHPKIAPNGTLRIKALASGQLKPATRGLVQTRITDPIPTGNTASSINMKNASCFVRYRNTRRRE